jgi:hypothetical protein
MRLVGWQRLVCPPHLHRLRVPQVPPAAASVRMDGMIVAQWRVQWRERGGTAVTNSSDRPSNCRCEQLHRGNMMTMNARSQQGARRKKTSGPALRVASATLHDTRRRHSHRHASPHPSPPPRSTLHTTSKLRRKEHGGVCSAPLPAGTQGPCCAHCALTACTPHTLVHTPHQACAHRTRLCTHNRWPALPAVERL